MKKKKFLTSFVCAFTILASLSASTVFTKDQQKSIQNQTVATSYVCSPTDPINW